MDRHDPQRDFRYEPSITRGSGGVRTPHRCIMKSVPPRGSGWVGRRFSKTSQMLGLIASASRTHPLPRGGTDLITLEPEFSHSCGSGWVSPTASSTLGEIRDNRSGPIFVFHTDEFWLNLHHFLYVLGRAENKERDTAREAVAGAPADQERGFKKLSVKEQKIWREAVASYAADVSKRDLVFDSPLPAVTNALARAGDARSLTGSEIDAGVATILERAAPIYRKAWWKQHRNANRNWQKSIQALVDAQGAPVLAFITNAYKLEWPAVGFPVHVSGYSNWAGAYSTTGNLLVMSSQSPGLQGLYGFETVFHEGMHQWDAPVFEALRQQATKLNRFFPRGLDHSLIFFTAGEAVRRTVPGHVPYAEKYGVWQRGMGLFKAALEEIWKPYLDGRGTRDEAFAALIVRTAVEPPKKTNSN